ncbi:MAG: CIA30 family protein [Treponema sp.]|nr:CIA30 family protein [Candidatus Treponema equi]
MKKIFVLLAAALLCTGAFAQTVKSWSGLGDADNGGSSTANVSVKDGVTNFSGVVTTKFQYGYATLTMDADPSFTEALKTAKGLKVTVKGDGKKYNFRVETNDRPDYCFHQYAVQATAKETTYTILYKSLKQDSWGKQVPFKPENITQVSFQTIGQPINSYSLDVVKVEIIK